MLRFVRSFSTFPTLLKQAAATKTTTKAPKPKAAAKPKAPKKVKVIITKEERARNGKLNKAELSRLFDEPFVTSYDKVKLLRRFVNTESMRTRQPAYNQWLSDEHKKTPSSKIPELAAQFKQLSESEKDAIREKYNSKPAVDNPYSKWDFKTIKNSKLSGLNLYMRERLKNASNIFEEGKLKPVVEEWRAFSPEKQKSYIDQALQDNKDNKKNLEDMHAQVRELYLKEIKSQE